MKMAVQKMLFPHIKAFIELMFQQTYYRVAMCVTEVMVFKSAIAGDTGYYICPRCHITMEREFMSYCDRCGQHLDWRYYKKAIIIYPDTIK